jgi:hypothetical protein
MATPTDTAAPGLLSLFWFQCDDILDSIQDISYHQTDTLSTTGPLQDPQWQSEERELGEIPPEANAVIFIVIFFLALFSCYIWFCCG